MRQSFFLSLIMIISQRMQSTWDMQIIPPLLLLFMWIPWVSGDWDQLSFVTWIGIIQLVFWDTLIVSLPFTLRPQREKEKANWLVLEILGFITLISSMNLSISILFPYWVDLYLFFFFFLWVLFYNLIESMRVRTVFGLKQNYYSN